MPIESPGFISNLNPAWPTDTDPCPEGDNHIRNFKQSVQASLPNINGEVSRTPDELNATVGASESNPLQAQLTALASRVTTLENADPADAFNVGDARILTTADLGSMSTKWRLAQGQALLKASFPELDALYSAAGYPYGSDASNLFLPNVNARSVVFEGAASGLTTRAAGDTGGEETVTLDGTNTPPHRHHAMHSQEINNESNSVSSNEAARWRLRNVGDSNYRIQGRGAGVNADVALTSNPVGDTGGALSYGQPFGIMHPFITLYLAIKVLP